MMRDLMFALLMLLALPLAIARPLNSYLLWGWTAVLVPTSYFYGFMVDARLNLVFAIITISLILFGRVSLASYQSNRVTWMYLAFFFHGMLAYFFAIRGNPINAEYFVIFAKGLLFCLVMPYFIRERLHFHAFLIMLVLGLGLHGVLNGLKTIVSAGGHNTVGPEGTMIGDRNHLSVALVLALPLFYYLFLQSKEKIIRILFLCGFVVVALAVAGSGSRGGFIALAFVLVWLVATSRQRWRASIFIGLLAVAFFTLAPQDWFDRLSTIEDAGQDASFVGRLIAWNVSSAIALDNPIFGGGFRAVQVAEIFSQYKNSSGLLDFLNLPYPEFAFKAAHSVYFEILGDLGFVGLFLFLLIMIHAIKSRFEVRRIASELGVGWAWARDLADMLMLAVLAYLIGGAGVSLGYFEVIYMIVMLMEMLRIHVRRAKQERAISIQQDGVQ